MDYKEGWEYWKEPDFPKHEHDVFGGVDSDPDHCIGCCEQTKNYLLSKIREAHAAGVAEGEAKYKERLMEEIKACNDNARKLDEAEAKLAALTAELADAKRIDAVHVQDQYPLLQRALKAERELAKLTIENKRMRPALQWAYDVLNHGEIPVPRKGHSCGPDSNCDGDCVDASRFADGMAEIQKALSPESEKPAPDGEGRKI